MYCPIYAVWAADRLLGLYLGQINFLASVRDQVKIVQKKLVYTPFDKLTNAFVTAALNQNRGFSPIRDGSPQAFALRLRELKIYTS